MDYMMYGTTKGQIWHYSFSSSEGPAATVSLQLQFHNKWRFQKMTHLL